MTSLPEEYRAAVIGASGAIGGAVAAALTADPRCGSVLRFARRGDPSDHPIDLTDEASIAAAAGAAGAGGAPLHLLFIATGGLIIDGDRPEKALSHLNADALHRQFALNAVGPALALKHFSGALPRQGRSLVGALSARVGSIGDNRLGGWYGYRAAKAALNQFIRAGAVELARSRRDAVVAALHPGTVESPLSQPFRPQGAGASGVLTPEDAAARLLRVLDGLGPADSGTFWDYAGAPIPW